MNFFISPGQIKKIRSYFKSIKAWILPVIIIAMGLPFFPGYITGTPRVEAPPRVESPVSVTPVLFPIVRPAPENKESAAELLPTEITPVLTYIEARATREVTAYNAGDIEQCDADPCISANGENLCQALEKGLGRCAANFVPLGTRLWIQDIGECLVTDRMNRRFKHRVDIAMPLAEKKQARAFGKKQLEVKILAQM